jgi:hypothetical protein
LNAGNSDLDTETRGIDYSGIEASYLNDGYAGLKTSFLPIEGSGQRVHPGLRNLNASTRLAYKREREKELLNGRELYVNMLAY